MNHKTVIRCTIALISVASLSWTAPALADHMLPQTIKSLVTGPMFQQQGGVSLHSLFDFQAIPGNRVMSESNWKRGVWLTELGKSPQVKQEYQQALSELGLHRMVMAGMQVRMIRAAHYQVAGSDSEPVLILPATLQSRPAGTTQPWTTVGAYTVSLQYAGQSTGSGLGPTPVLVGIQVKPR